MTKADFIGCLVIHLPSLNYLPLPCLAFAYLLNACATIRCHVSSLLVLPLHVLPFPVLHFLLLPSLSFLFFPNLSSPCLSFPSVVLRRPANRCMYDDF